MTRPKKVQKRDGSLVPFAGEKIQNAIAKAAGEVLQDSISARAIASKLTATVIQKLFAQYKGQTLHVEAIQDAVETVLMEEGYSRIAKSYILYRERRSDIRSDQNRIEYQLLDVPAGSSLCLPSVLSAMYCRAPDYSR